MTCRAQAVRMDWAGLIGPAWLGWFIGFEQRVKVRHHLQGAGG